MTHCARRQCLQTVPDALPHIPGQREEGDPASTDKFLEIGEGKDDNNEAEEDDTDDAKHKINNRDGKQQNTPSTSHRLIGT
jgi:hypothetical protein